MTITRVMRYSALLLAALAASAQQPASQPPKERISRTRVVLLGTGTPVPDPDRSGPATALLQKEIGSRYSGNFVIGRDLDVY